MAEEVVNNEEHEDESGLIPEDVLRTHELANSTFCGSLEKLQEGLAEVRLSTNSDMRVDMHGLVHGGFIFSAADFAAMAAVNDPNVVLSAATTTFLSPVRAGDDVIFKAKTRHKEGRKREVDVVGMVLEVKVFEGLFKTVVLDKHILKLDLMNASKSD